MVKKKREFKVVLKALIYNKDGKILIIRRSKTHPTQPLFWDLPGGYLEFGEKIEKSILREIKEETRLKVKSLFILDAITNFDTIHGFRVIIYYIAKSDTSKVLLSWEHDSFKWATKKEFVKLKASPNCNPLIKKLGLLK